MSPHYDRSLKQDEQNGDDSHSQQPLSNGHSNGITNGYQASSNTSPSAQPARPKKQHRNRSRYLVSSPPNSEFDLICVGFGPASLAIAVALHDSLAKPSSSSSSSSSRPSPPPKVIFLEKQASFAWHAGMLLPGAKMQISFIKDLATLRDPRSEFTFLNYLHTQGRLVDFTNLGTFLPARVEYEDYLRWSASFFDEVVRYEQQVVSIAPETKTAAAATAAAAAAAVNGADDAVRMFTVTAMNVRSGQMESFRGRNVLVAAGGQPSIPKMLPASHSRVIHSSQYANCVSRLLPDANAPYRIAVMGAGQSAAEIFHNAQRQYPNAQVWLIMRQEFLRPSDDSPFVNSVFNPDYIDAMYPRSSQQRSKLITEARATNYGVVRLELLEALYEHMYDQRRELGADEKTWPHRILGAREVTSVKSQSEGKLVVKVQPVVHGPSNGFSLDEDVSRVSHEEETMVADLVIAATGYRRTAHVDMLHDTWDMLPDETSSATSNTHAQEGVTGWTIHDSRGEKRTMAVGRDYKVKYAPGRVEDGSGVWLQGCCEGTHGLSDTLLSVLATRSGEIVESIFGSRPEASP